MSEQNPVRVNKAAAREYHQRLITDFSYIIDTRTQFGVPWLPRAVQMEGRKNEFSRTWPLIRPTDMHARHSYTITHYPGYGQDIEGHTAVAPGYVVTVWNKQEKRIAQFTPPLHMYDWVAYHQFNPDDGKLLPNTPATDEAMSRYVPKWLGDMFESVARHRQFNFPSNSIGSKNIPQDAEERQQIVFDRIQRIMKPPNTKIEYVVQNPIGTQPLNTTLRFEPPTSEAGIYKPTHLKVSTMYEYRSPPKGEVDRQFLEELFDLDIIRTINIKRLGARLGRTEVPGAYKRIINNEEQKVPIEEANAHTVIRQLTHYLEVISDRQKAEERELFEKLKRGGDPWNTGK